MKSISNIFGKIEDVFLIVSAGLIGIIMLLTIVDVSGRFAFNKPLLGNVEIAELLLLATIWFAVAGTQRVGGNIGMDLVVDKIGRTRPKLYSAFQISALFITLGLFVFLSHYSTNRFLSSLDIHEKTLGPLYIAAWPFIGFIALGVYLLCIRLLIQLIQAINSARSRDK